MARKAREGGRHRKTETTCAAMQSVPHVDEGHWIEVDDGLYTHLVHSGKPHVEVCATLDLDSTVDLRPLLATILRDARTTSQANGPLHHSYEDFISLRAHVKRLRKALKSDDAMAAVKCAIVIGRYWERFVIRRFEHFALTGKKAKNSLAAGPNGRREAAARTRQQRAREAQEALRQAALQMTAKHPTRTAIHEKAAELLEIKPRTLYARLRSLKSD